MGCSKVGFKKDQIDFSKPGSKYNVGKKGMIKE